MATDFWRKPVMRRLNQWISMLLLVATACLLAACPGGSALDGGNTAQSSGQFSATGTGKADGAIGGEAAATAQKIFAKNSEAPSGSNSDYKISPLDVVDITVFGVKDLDRTVQVSSSGMITLPLIKQVQAGGLTQAELEREIARKLDAAYLQSPQVSVFVKEYNSQRVTVDGAVKKPGIFPTTGRISLLQAIALAEGLNDVADPSGILLFRTINNKRMVARYDLKMVRSGKINDPMLQAGDIVMVDESSTKTTLRQIKDVMPLSGLFQLLAL
jgi:polysaccharide biosynthesis/export protein